MSMTHWKTNTTVSPEYLSQFKNLLNYAQLKNKVVTVFDLETTTFLGRRGFGITEIGMVHITPKGHIGVSGSLINPEARISPEVQSLTGITNDMVRDLLNFGELWAEAIAYIAKNHVFIGFNSASFDLKALQQEYKKYTESDLHVEDHIDLRKILVNINGTSKGKLPEQAALLGIDIKDFKGHRAVNDALLTAKILDGVIEKYPEFESLHTSKIKAGAAASSNKDSSEKSKKPTQKDVISNIVSTQFLNNPVYAENIINDMAKNLQLQYTDKTIDQLVTSISFQIGTMIDNGHIPVLTPTNNGKLSILQDSCFKELVAEVWSSPNLNNKLAPLLILLNDKHELVFDYVDLRYGLYHHGIRVSSFKGAQTENTLDYA